MAIKTGDMFPSVKLKTLSANGLEEFDTAEALKGKKVVLFAVPGAFTPACAQKHLPGYVSKAAEIKATGVDDIICLAVNDPFVMAHWSETAGADGKVFMWADGNGQLADRLGLTFDGAGAGLGRRYQRFVMVIENGAVKSLEVEAKPSDVELSSAGTCLARLAA
jgi:peroxiredoxin